MEKITLRLASQDPDNSLLAASTRIFQEVAEELSGGRIQFETYYSGSIMTPQ